MVSFFLGSLLLVVVGLVLFGLFCFALKLKEWFFLFVRGLTLEFFTWLFWSLEMMVSVWGSSASSVNMLPIFFKCERANERACRLRELNFFL